MSIDWRQILMSVHMRIGLKDKKAKNIIPFPPFVTLFNVTVIRLLNAYLNPLPLQALHNCWTAP